MDLPDSKPAQPPKTSSAALEPGQSAPDFELRDQQGQPHRLSRFAGRWVVLYFYPRDNTPGCAAEACEFRDNMEQARQRDLVILGISPDDESSHARFATKHSLTFPLLADGAAQVCQAYGVWREKTRFGRTAMGVERSTYLIDPGGKVAYCWAKVKVEGHVATVIAKHDELAGR